MLTHKKVRIIFVVYGINRKSLRHNLFFGILQYIVLLNWLHCFQFEYNYGLNDTIIDSVLQDLHQCFILGVKT